MVGRACKVSVATIAVASIIAFGYPLANEETANPCLALENRVAILTAEKSDIPVEHAAFMPSPYGGAVAFAISRRKHPWLPPVVNCTYSYWRTFIGDQPKIEVTAAPTDAAAMVDQAQKLLDRERDAA